MTHSSEAGRSVPLERDTADEAEPYTQASPGFAQYALARAALLDARALSTSPEGAGPALLLLRAAIILFARAHQRRGGWLSGRGDTPEADAAPVAASPVVKSALEKLSGEERAAILALLSPDGENQLALLDAADQRRLLMGLERVALEVGAPLDAEAEPVRRAFVRRWTLRAGAAVLIVAALAWTGDALFRKSNLALHRPVTISSNEKAARVRTRALVDGDRKNLGFHTKKGRGESVVIDLESVETINTVNVYNRLDCCQQRAVPLRLEVSTDGTTYTLVGRRKETFTVWTTKLPPTPARFVRLTNESNNFFHLSEVEVY